MFSKELNGDLFNSTDSLAHCVSSDMKMSRGIAVQFVKHFPGLGQLTSIQGIGGVIVLQSGSRYIFNLVTKLKFYHKPKYCGLRYVVFGKFTKHSINARSDKTFYTTFGVWSGWIVLGQSQKYD